jgi:hypothetical protein
MNENIEDKIMLPDEVIMDKIYLIRGQKVMLDRNLAELYGVETKYLKRQVRRNMLRFPNDFMFELTKQELNIWRSQFGTSNAEMIGLRYPPFAFTETGVAQLSGVLNSKMAILINNQIMRVFIKFRQMMSTHKDLEKRIDEMERKYNNRFQIVFETLDQLLTVDSKPKKIGYLKEDQAEYMNRR